MKRQVAVIGTGRVGSSVAISILQSGIADELLLYDLHEERAEGEAMDLAHGAPFYPAASVRVATVDEMADADAVVIATGRGGRVDESRLELLRDNVAAVRIMGQRLIGYRGVVIIVTNPVDVLTQVMTEASGLPPARVIGTGTMLDTARLKHVIGRVLNVDAHSVHAHVVGEHGDSEVILWSTARVAGRRLSNWAAWGGDHQSSVADEVQRAGNEIIRRKGATNHAIGLVTADLLRAVLRNERRLLTVSRLQDGGLGLGKVALSLPAVVGVTGADVVIEPDMNAEERERLERSASLLHASLIELKSSS